MQILSERWKWCCPSPFAFPSFGKKINLTGAACWGLGVLSVRFIAVPTVAMGAGWAAALAPASLSRAGVTTQIPHHTAHFTFFGFYLSLGFCLTFEYWVMRSWKTAVRDGLVQSAFLSAWKSCAVEINSTAQILFFYRAEMKGQGRLLCRICTSSWVCH